MQRALDQMLAAAMRHAREPRIATPIPRLSINMCFTTTPKVSLVYEPVLCIVLQGAKEVTIGNRRLRYDRAGYFIASLDVPATGHIAEASRERPFVSLCMSLDREGLAALIGETAPNASGADSSFAVSPITEALLQPFQRLIDLLDAPHDIPVLAPLIEREIYYRLLQGPQGGLLRQIASADSRLNQVRRAIAWIRGNFDQTMRVDALAEQVGMSSASFHRHFKAATAMSPLQFQKMLRLQRARQLLVANEDAARVAFAVGYESASQFSREYARLFGAPPARDASRLRSAYAAFTDAATF